MSVNRLQHCVGEMIGRHVNDDAARCEANDAISEATRELRLVQATDDRNAVAA